MKIVKLGDICEFKPKKSRAKNILDGKALVSFAPMERLPIGQKYFTPTEEKILDSVYSSYTYFKENDVIYAKITPCFENGKLSIAKNLKNGIGFGSSEFVPIRCSADILPEYLYYYLLDPSFIQNGAPKMVGASGHRRIPNEYAENLTINLPSIEEQLRIVAQLDAAFEKIDQAIELTQKNISSTKALEEASINQYLDTQDDRRIDTIANLSDLTTDYVANGSFSSLKKNVTHKSDEDYAILIRLIDRSRGFRGPFVYVDEHSYRFLKKSSIEPGDIIISNVGARLGTIFRAPDLGKRMTLGPNSILLRSSEYGDFLYVWLRSSVGQKAIKSLVGGAGQPKFNKTDFRNMLVSIPKNKTTRNTIVNQILETESSLNKLLDLYQRRMKKLENLKSSLLAQVFSTDKV